MKRLHVLRIGIDRISLDEAVERSLDVMDKRESRYVITPNSEFLLCALKSPGLCSAADSAFLSLPDSVGVLLVASILGLPLHEKIPGVDFAEALLEKMGQRGKSVFLLGAKKGIAEKAADKVSIKYPGLVIAGTSSGYYPPHDEDKLIERINAASPDLLIVCLGSPKQELWMHKNAARLHIGLMAGLGGTIDVLAGAVDRAPLKWREAGFEWLYRVYREPKRILRVLRIPLVILVSLWYRIGGKIYE